ncbi:DNA polymerase eta [Camellia lanceoleosa]|uniref:DNA polymerase eta n=1 Tax=Camellia lanceoleosa TaxID=1840588 RepID=A0ACC0I4S1_9ERIC|nr:DNA polymerase eta [Camellia lanceoleosa]
MWSNENDPIQGSPIFVMQYNSGKVGFDSFSMRGDEVKQVCPQIQLVQVPVARDKADLSIYRNAGSEVVSILARNGRCERVSIDEVYLDLTDAAEAMLAETPPESLEKIDEEALKSHILSLNEDGSDHNDNVREWLHRSDAIYLDKLLACGAFIVAELRVQVLKETEFTCSARIAHNKVGSRQLSSFADAGQTRKCYKPTQQTVVPFTSIKGLLEHLPIKKMKQLGGKLRSSLQIDLGVNTVGELLQFSEEKLQERYGVNTRSLSLDAYLDVTSDFIFFLQFKTWLRNIARGINGEEVEGRLLPKSHGSGKTFHGPRALKKIASSSDSESQKIFPFKSCPLRYGSAKIKEDALNLFQAGLREYFGSHRIKAQGSHYNGWGITSLSVTASKIVAIPSGTCSIMKYFHGQDQSNCSSRQVNDRFIAEAAPFFAILVKYGILSGTERYPELHTTELPIEFREEETRIRCAMPSLDQQEKQGRSIYERELERAFHMVNNPSSFLVIFECAKVLEIFVLNLKLVRTESCLALNPVEPHREFHKEEIGIKNLTHGMRPHDHKRKMVKDKGSSTILRFFQSCNNSSSSSKQEHVRTIDETKASSSSSFQSVIGSFELIEAELRKENLLTQTGTHSGMSILDRDDMRRDAWDYKIDEIDPTVVNELLPEIQEELQVWLRPQKRVANIGKRGSSIAHYFLPTKNT